MAYRNQNYMTNRKIKELVDANQKKANITEEENNSVEQPNQNNNNTENNTQNNNTENNNNESDNDSTSIEGPHVSGEAEPMIEEDGEW